MWCAYFFVLLALFGFPENTNLIQWVSQTFIQLVMLSVIMVGQRIFDEANGARANEQYQMICELHDKVLHTHRKLDDMHDKVKSLADRSE